MRPCLAAALLVALAARAAPRPTGVSIPLRDGARLAADLYHRDDGRRRPLVILQTPYNKTGLRPALTAAEPRGALFASDQYDFLVVDWRGRHASADAGGDGPRRLGLDGYDVIEWAAAQPWCGGKIGTWGPSALGQVQYRSAEQRPPHLAACVPLVACGAYRYDRVYPGGVLRRELVDTFDLLGFALRSPLEQHPEPDGFWRLAAAGWRPERIAAPMLLIAGWYDINLPDSLHDFTTLRARGDPAARADHRLLIGPWSHSRIDALEQGELAFPEAEGAAGRAALAWFDRWLRGLPAADTPPIEYLQMLDNQWQQAAAWPRDDLREATFHLAANGALTAEPGPAPNALWPYDPTDPCPTLGGAVLNPRLRAGPCDLTPLLARADVATFTSAPLAADLRLCGPAQVTLEASIDPPPSTLTARLAHLNHRGQTLLITDSAARVPATGEVTIALPDTAYTIPAGHRLRLVLSTANSPRFDPPGQACRVAIRAGRVTVAARDD